MKTFVKKIIIKLMPECVIIWKKRYCKSLVALTFDDGPNSSVTPRILDILKQENSKATFFVVGEAVKKHKEIVLRMKREGHSLGLHSWDHKNYNKLSSKQRQGDIKLTQQALKAINIKTHFFRPPHGFLSLPLLLSCAFKKITTVMWSYDSLDYKEKDSEALINKIRTADINSGDILLFHDDMEITAVALPEIIKTLRSRGFDLVSLDELTGRLC